MGMNESVKRNQYYGFVKGIAIMLVVIGHCIQFGSGTQYLLEQDFFDNICFKFIYGCHMPLLIFDSGIFFSYTRKKYPAFIILRKNVSV